MKTKFTLLILLLASFGSLHAQTKLTDPEPFAKEVFSALRKGQPLDTFCLVEGHKPWMLEVYSEQSPERDRARIQEMVDGKFTRFTEEFAVSLSEVRGTVEWSRANFNMVTYRVDKDNDRMYEGRIDIQFTIEGKVHELRLTHCVLTKSGWKLGGEMYFRELE